MLSQPFVTNYNPFVTFSRMSKRSISSDDLSWCDEVDSQYNSPWEIAPHSLDVLADKPLSVRFTPDVSFNADFTVSVIDDKAWLAYVQKCAVICCREGEAIYGNYVDKKKESKRLHYHAIVVSNKDAFRQRMHRLGLKGVFCEQIEDNRKYPNWSLTKAFRYMCKDGDMVVRGNYPVERIHDDYWATHAEVAAYKAQPKAKRIKSNQSWFDFVQSKVSNVSMSAVDIGCEILDIYRQHGKQLPAHHTISAMINTIMFDNNKNVEFPLSRHDLFRRLYPNLA